MWTKGVEKSVETSDRPAPKSKKDLIVSLFNSGVTQIETLASLAGTQQAMSEQYCIAKD